MVGHRHRGASCYGPDTDTYISTKFSPKTIDYALQKKVHNPPLSPLQKGAKGSSSVYEKVQRVPFLQKGGGYCMCPRRSDAKKTHHLYKHTRPTNSGMKY